MTKREKLIARLRARPRQASFGDVTTLLEGFGWTLNRQKGSHVTFIKDGERSLSFPVVGGQYVKGIYVDHIFARLDLDDRANRDSPSSR